MSDDAQQFLNDLDKKLWNAADRLRASLDAAVYKHAVLGLIFLKYVSDSFRMRQDEVTAALKDPGNDYFLDPADYGGANSGSGPDDYAEAIRLGQFALAEGKKGGQFDFNFGKEPANSFTNDQHPDLRADSVMANPPFNIKEWWDGKLDGDPRWKYGTPPKGNANFAWVQHMLHHLAPNGSMALLEADLVECMVALPGQLFTNTQIPACIWFLTKNKGGRPSSPRPPLPEGAGNPSGPHQPTSSDGLRDRRGQVLFIDARQLGFMKDRVLRDFADEDKEKIAGTFRKWKRDDGYEDEAGFCKSATLEEIAKHDHVVTPGRYVGAADEEEDAEPFAEKMARLTQELHGQFEESKNLETAIRKNLEGLGL